MTTRITTPYDATSTGLQAAEGIDLTGRSAVVTGAASGIGVETAHALASTGAAVTLAVRNVAAGQRSQPTSPRRQAMPPSPSQAST